MRLHRPSGGWSAQGPRARRPDASGAGPLQEAIPERTALADTPSATCPSHRSTVLSRAQNSELRTEPASPYAVLALFPRLHTAPAFPESPPPAEAGRVTHPSKQMRPLFKLRLPSVQARGCTLGLNEGCTGSPSPSSQRSLSRTLCPHVLRRGHTSPAFGQRNVFSASRAVQQDSRQDCRQGAAAWPLISDTPAAGFVLAVLRAPSASAGGGARAHAVAVPWYTALKPGDAMLSSDCR